MASELGPNLATVLYIHAGEVVEYRDGLLHSVSAQKLRTLAEQFVLFYKVYNTNETVTKVGVTLDESDSRGILVSPQFAKCLNPLRHLNTVRLPVLRSRARSSYCPKAMIPKQHTHRCASGLQRGYAVCQCNSGDS